MSKSRYRKGTLAGGSYGYNYGFHLGACRGVMNRLHVPGQKVWDITVFYVASGISYPYGPLDQAIIGTLEKMVKKLVVLRHKDNIEAAVTEQRPDLVLILEGIPRYPINKLNTLRKLDIRTAVWLSDDPYYSDLTSQIVSHYDYVFTLEKQCVEWYRSLGAQAVYYLPFGVDPHMYYPKKVRLAYHTEVCFIGSAFWNRVQLFDQISPYLRRKNVLISGLWWNRLTNYRRLSSKIRLNHWMTPQRTASFYNGAKIVINLHRSPYDDTFNHNKGKLSAQSPNPRTFEIAACGTLQLTDQRQDMGQFYEPNREIVEYKDATDLIDKIEHYLQHEEERREISVRALRKTMEKHTYSHRLSQMLTTIFGEP